MPPTNRPYSSPCPPSGSTTRIFRTPSPKISTIDSNRRAIYYIPYSEQQAPSDDELDCSPATPEPALLRRACEEDDWFQKPDYPIPPPTGTANRMPAHNAHHIPAPTARHRHRRFGNAFYDESSGNDNAVGESANVISSSSRFSFDTHSIPPSTGWPGRIFLWHAKRKIARIMRSARTHVQDVFLVFERAAEKMVGA